jgi:hypothetical protein
MVWSVVFLILAQLSKNRKNLITIGLATLIICMLPFQIKAIQNKTSGLTERSVAALSLALNLQDEDQIKSILPSAKWGLELSKAPREKGYSIFGYGDIHNLIYFLNSKNFEIEAEKDCGSKVYVDKVRLLNKFSDENNQYISISGWVFNQNIYSNNVALQIVDTKRLPIGVGFIGIERPDVASVYGKKALNSGFKAYIKFNKKNEDFFIRNINDSCWTSFKLDLSEI